MPNAGNALSLYFGYHDSCVTYSSDERILLHLEAERYYRKKHITVTAPQMLELIQVGLDYLKMDIDDFDSLFLASWNNQFPANKITINGNTFEPILTGHHENHIGTTFPAGFITGLIVCADGGSEDGTTKFYLKDGTHVSLLVDLDEEPITGKFYGTITQMIIDPDFTRAHDTNPGKTMGLVAYGEYSEEFAQLLEEYWPEINKLHYEGGVEHLLRLFDLSNDYTTPWKDKRRRDLAHTAQIFWQERFLEWIRKFSHLSKNVCLVGGCALNVLLNSAIVDLGLFENVYVTPVSGDGGQSLGALLFNNPELKCDYPYLGRAYGDVERVPEGLIEDLLNQKIVSWYQGRSEVGARALGHRSFLGIPVSEEMKFKLSQRVKKREPYRPIAPIIAEEYAGQFFETQSASPYMTFAPRARRITNAKAPAIVHFDGTSRIQTLSAADNPILHRVLLRIGDSTGAPILMNSSFNVAGEPIVDTPEHALANFAASESEVLYINGERYEK